MPDVTADHAITIEGGVERDANDQSSGRARTARTAVAEADAHAHALVLNVALQDIHPPIRRQLPVPDRPTLHQRHRVLQLAFDWLDYHLYQFAPATAGRGAKGADRARVRYTVPDPEWNAMDDAAEVQDTQDITLRALALRRGARLP